MPRHGKWPDGPHVEERGGGVMSRDFFDGSGSTLWRLR